MSLTKLKVEKLIVKFISTKNIEMTNHREESEVKYTVNKFIVNMGVGLTSLEYQIL